MPARELWLCNDCLTFRQITPAHILAAFLKRLMRPNKHTIVKNQEWEVFFTFSSLCKAVFWGCQNGSASTGVCHQAWWAVCNPWDLLRRGKPTPASYLPGSTGKLWHAPIHPHAHTFFFFNVKKPQSCAFQVKNPTESGFFSPSKGSNKGWTAQLESPCSLRGKRVLPP